MSFFHEAMAGFKEFGENLAMIVNCVLLTVVYFVAVGPTSVIAKLAKKRFIPDEKKETYWEELNLGKKPEEDYYRQF